MKILVGYDGSDGGRDALELVSGAERLAAGGRELNGAPAPAIVDACEEAGADLLVAGARGYGPVPRARSEEP